MKPILLDVDAGVDDTLAIIFALLSPRLDVKAITTVAGNVPVQSCTRNVLLTLEILKPFLANLPVVAQGASKPLKLSPFTAKEVHGTDGIGNASRLYSAPNIKRRSGHAVDVILATAKREKELTLVATGPLTNVAQAIKKDFSTMKRVHEIVVMGGGFNGVHNTGPVAEFNFYVDPDAADIVMHSGIPITLIPLNVTERCTLAPGDLHAVANVRLRRYIQRVTKFYFDFHKRTEGFNGGYLHDPLAVAAALEPSLLRMKEGYVNVETSGKYTRGMSVFFPHLDIRKEAELPPWVKRALRRLPSVRVAISVDAKTFRRKFLASLARPS